MARFELLGVITAALLLALFIASFSASGPAPVRGASSTPSASSLVLATTTPLAFPKLPLIEGIGATSTPATPPPAKTLVPALSHTPAPTASPSPAAQAPAATQSALDASAAKLRGALVNIICIASIGSSLHSISGSGVMIGSNGYILTNAHVAQYFLLDDQGISCGIRTGNPAALAYRASLAFIPALWIRDNSSVLLNPAPSGTGERDFAILAVTSSASDAPLPGSYPGLSVAFSAPAAGTPVVVGSYGAQFLEFEQIETALFPTLVFGAIRQQLTFDTNTPDVVALGGSAAAQEGSSGGGVTDSSGALVADITTSTITGDTSTRSLSAITTDYIRREYRAETNRTLDDLLATPPGEAVADFALQAPALEAILLAVLHPH